MVLGRYLIPDKQSGEFVACMEDVLDVYTRAYPVVCMDESPKQLFGEVREPVPMKPGYVRKIDDEYERKGVAELLLAVEPLTGYLRVDVLARRTKQDWAHFIKALVDDEYPNCEKLILVMDNLNTHRIGSLYETFQAEQAHRIAQKIEIHYTPKHGSWLNVAEIGFSLLKRQCLPERVGSIEELNSYVTSYVKERNSYPKKVNWQFKTADARIKLCHLYPEL